MYNDLLGDKKRKLQGRWSLEIAQDLKDEKIEEGSEHKFHEINDEKVEGSEHKFHEINHVIVDAKSEIDQLSSEINKLTLFLLRNFGDHIEEGSAVDNAIILLQKALDYELEVCGGCSHKEKLKYLADHDMIKDV